MTASVRPLAVCVVVSFAVTVDVTTGVDRDVDGDDFDERRVDFATSLHHDFGNEKFNGWSVNRAGYCFNHACVLNPVRVEYWAFFKQGYEQ